MRFLKDHVSRLINSLGAYKRTLSTLVEDEYAMAFMNLSIFRYVLQLQLHVMSCHVMSCCFTMSVMSCVFTRSFDD
jgi:hypothetical protein